MKVPGGARVETDLRHYLQNRSTLISPEINHVVADVNRFTSAVATEGFHKALAEIGIDLELRADRPFIEICDAMIEHHVRFVPEAERQLVAKSLFEAYVYFAGPQHVFEPASRTRLIRSLQRRGAKSFAALFLSLHLFNVISMHIRDDVSARIHNVKSFERYMLNVEAKCRDVVRRAVEIPTEQLDERWAAAVRHNIEAQLLGRS